ncbi:MAG: tyrosine-type recombinase/integrase [Gammaproteobacteria bacterium]
MKRHTGPLPEGIELRGESIRMSFSWRGVRCRETIRILPTAANVRHVQRWRENILFEIATNQFDYAKHFPDSAMAGRFRPGANTRVAQALEAWLAAQKRLSAPSTFEDYCNTVRHHLVPAFGDLKLSELTKSAIKEWIGGLDCSAKRINNLLIPLRGMLADAMDDGLIERNPMATVRNLKRDTFPRPDPFTPEEVGAILSACRQEVHRNLWQFAFSTGLRPSELMALAWGDIDWPRGVVCVRRSIVRGHERSGTKTEAGVREVKLLPPALQALTAQKAHTFLLDSRVFLNPNTRKPFVASKQLEKIWGRIVARAQVRYRNPYQTRHTYASTLLTAGEDPTWVSQQMGHADWGMIRKVYARWIPELRPDAGNKAADLMGQNWGKPGTTEANLGQLGQSPTDPSGCFLEKRWRSGRDSNPRPPA